MWNSYSRNPCRIYSKTYRRQQLFVGILSQPIEGIWTRPQFSENLKRPSRMRGENLCVRELRLRLGRELQSAATLSYDRFDSTTEKKGSVETNKLQLWRDANKSSAASVIQPRREREKLKGKFFEGFVSFSHHRTHLRIKTTGDCAGGNLQTTHCWRGRCEQPDGFLTSVLSETD